jgi:hypothetical protein
MPILLYKLSSVRLDNIVHNIFDGRQVVYYLNKHTLWQRSHCIVIKTSSGNFASQIVYADIVEASSFDLIFIVYGYHLSIFKISPKKLNSSDRLEEKYKA